MITPRARSVTEIRSDVAKLSGGFEDHHHSQTLCFTTRTWLSPAGQRVVYAVCNPMNRETAAELVTAVQAPPGSHLVVGGVRPIPDGTEEALDEAAGGTLTITVLGPSEIPRHTAEAESTPPPASVDVTVGGVDFDRLTLGGRPWDGFNWWEEDPEYERVDCGGRPGEVPWGTWSVAYEMTESWADVLLATAFLASLGERFEIARSADDEMYLILTNYVSPGHRTHWGPATAVKPPVIPKTAHDVTQEVLRTVLFHVSSLGAGKVDWTNVFEVATGCVMADGRELRFNLDGTDDQARETIKRLIRARLADL